MLVFDIDFFQAFCPQCGIVCRQQDSLEQHMKTIQGGLFETQFSCVLNFKTQFRYEIDFVRNC